MLKYNCRVKQDEIKPSDVFFPFFVNIFSYALLQNNAYISEDRKKIHVNFVKIDMYCYNMDMWDII